MQDFQSLRYRVGEQRQGQRIPNKTSKLWPLELKGDNSCLFLTWKDSGSSKQWADAFLMTLSLSVFAFCSKILFFSFIWDLLLFIYYAIHHIFVYSFFAYARRALNYSKHGGVFVYVCVSSLRTCDVI